MSGVDRAQAEAVVNRLVERFGPGHSSGVHAIFAHKGLPEVFGKSEWENWFLKPADAAFDLAREERLIAIEANDKWRFTRLGLAVRSILQEQSA